MIKKIHVCDKCGNETITQGSEKAKYRTIKLGISEIDDAYAYFDRNYSGHVSLPNLYLCPVCLKEIGINDNHSKKYSILDEKDKTVEEKLIDLLIQLNVKFEE